MLRKPAKNEESAAQQIDRVDSTTEIFKDKMLAHVAGKLALQYADIYYVRLNTMRESVRKVVEDKHPGINILSKVLETNVGERCGLVGTIYKEMKLKPSVLDEYSKDFGLTAAVSVASYVSEKDAAVLEDESGRILLVGDNVSVDRLTTGTVVGVIGAENAQGEFVVEDICYPGLPPQTSNIAAASSAHGYLLLVGGLEMGSADGNPLLPQMLVDFAVGMLGDEADHEMSAKIAAVVFAGNSVTTTLDSTRKFQNLSSKEQQASISPLRDLDVLLAQAAASVKTFLMPGGNDPAEHFLPQQPFHSCLFPLSAAYASNSFFGLTNPADFVVNGRRICGTSGQNVDDICKFSNFDSRMAALQHTLESRIIAPTAPDTLGCHPFKDTDPFIIEECPHIYFAANQPEFESKLIEGPQKQKVCLVSLPAFSKTGIAALINLSTLECERVDFSAQVSA